MTHIVFQIVVKDLNLQVTEKDLVHLFQEEGLVHTPPGDKGGRQETGLF